MQEKKREVNRRNALATRSGRSSSEAEQTMALDQISLVESFLSAIPAEVLSRRAVECRSFARALYYWEQYIREQKVRPAITDEELEPLYERLQDIYTQIDEPDGIEGISSHLHVLNIDQQVLEHRKAGRWNAVQSWYELVLQEKPEDTEVQFSLLTSLKESGQHGLCQRSVYISKKLTISRCTIEPDRRVPTHRHKQDDVTAVRGSIGMDDRQMGKTHALSCW